MTAREGTQPPASPLVIDPGYAGLPDLAHGGYVAGVLTGALGAESSRVRLRRPVPPAQALRLERPRPGEIELHGDTGLLADGVAADVLLDVPAPVAPAEARAAARRFLRRGRHPFPHCLTCGPAHPRGLRVFPGPVAGRSLVAALWVPPVALAGARGHLPPRALPGDRGERRGLAWARRRGGVRGGGDARPR